MSTPRELARATLAEIETLVEALQDLIRSEIRLQAELGPAALDAALAAQPPWSLERLLTPALLKMGRHLLRLMTLVALEIDGHVPPRSRDGGRALLDLLTQATPARPALLRDHGDLRWLLRTLADPLWAVQQDPEVDVLLGRLSGLVIEVLPSLRTGLQALEPLLDAPPVPSGSGALAAKGRHAARLAALDQAAREVRALAATWGVEVRFFGSFARRRVHEESDLDVLVLGVEGDRRVEDFLDAFDGWKARLPVPADAVPQWFRPAFLDGAVP